MTNWHEWMRQMLGLIGLPASLAGSYVNAFIPVMRDLYGIDAYPILRSADIEPEQLAQPGFRLSLYRTFKLLKLAEEISGDPYVGLRLGQHVQPKSYEVLGYALMSRGNLQQAIEQLIRFDALIWDVGGTRLFREDGQAVLELNPLYVPWVPPQAFELAISGQMAFGRWITGFDGSPFAVTFRHGCRGDREIYEAVFGCEVRFNAPRNALMFPEEYLQLPLRYADPALAQIMIGTGQRLIENYREETNIASEVRALICELLPLAQQDMETVAERLEISSAQLSRRLQTAGCRFPELVDEVRLDLASHYLDQSDLALTDIAFLLGFSEQSAFTRAFKRWTGQAPNHYRRQHLASASL